MGEKPSPEASCSAFARYQRNLVECSDIDQLPVDRELAVRDFGENMERLADAGGFDQDDPERVRVADATRAFRELLLTVERTSFGVSEY